MREGIILNRQKYQKRLVIRNTINKWTNPQARRPLLIVRCLYSSGMVLFMDADGSGLLRIGLLEYFEFRNLIVEEIPKEIF